MWSLVFSALVIVYKGEGGLFINSCREMYRAKLPFIKMTSAALMIMINWGTYIYCVANGRVLESALAYFINPMLSILLGFVILKERLKKLEFLAIFISLSGVLIILVYNGTLPLLSLTMAIPFSLYGLIKKGAPLSPLHSLLFENLVLMPVVVPALLYLHFTGQGHFNFDMTGLLMVLGGPVTAIPLILYALALTKIELSSMGFLQFMSPTLLFLLGVFVYHEPLNEAYLYAFILIWTGIGIYIYSRFIADSLGRRITKS